MKRLIDLIISILLLILLFIPCLIISTIIILSALIGRDYYIYCTAESEDEVALIRFDGKVAHVEKRIPVGVWPVEIEGPHGITVSPDGNNWNL